MFAGNVLSNPGSVARRLGIQDFDAGDQGLYPAFHLVLGLGYSNTALRLEETFYTSYYNLGCICQNNIVIQKNVQRGKKLSQKS